MAVSNVSTFNSLQTLLQNMGQVQTSLNNDQIAISSGQKSQTFDGINGSINQFTSLNAQVSRLQDYQQNNTTYLSQLQTTSSVLGQIEQIATSVKSLIAAQGSGQQSAASFQQQLQSYQAQLTSSLNTTYAGNFLFSGTNNNTAPVTRTIPQPQSIGTPDNSYYHGSSEDTVTRIGDGQEITNSVRADNTAFQQIIGGIQQAINAVSGSTVDLASLQNAQDLVSSGIQGTIALQATTNANVVTVQQVQSQSQTLQTYYTSLTQGISQSDVVSLSSQVAQDQTILEASFEAFSRISSLTLANYLK